MTRKFIRKLAKEYNLPVAIFTDGDPFGARIAGNIIHGSLKSAHLSNLLCVPNAVHIGLHNSQIADFKLPTDSLTKIEKQAIKLMLLDERFNAWKDQLHLMLQTGKKAEQQAFAYYGIQAIATVYLPKILKKYGFPINT